MVHSFPLTLLQMFDNNNDTIKDQTSTRSCYSCHGPLHHFSCKSVALHNLPHMLFFLTLKDSHKVAQLRKAESIPLWKRSVRLQKQHYIQDIYCFFNFHLKKECKLTFTSPVSFSFKTRLKTASPGPASRRR